MKRLFLLLLTSFAFTQANAANVGVSVNIGEPGFYGQIDIGDYVPRPQVVYTQPVIIQHVPVYERATPIYLHVPPGHAKRWASYCGQYNACGRPVYFVKDSWYENEYVPRYREHHGHGDDDNDRHDDHYDRHDDRGDHGHGNGRHGHGHD
jgi:hypothetical protein